MYGCADLEQSTGIEWLITRFREYVVVREKVLLETMVIRKQLELNPNAELSAAAQEVEMQSFFLALLPPTDSRCLKWKLIHV